MMLKKVVVIGGGAAGFFAALNLAEEISSFEGRSVDLAQSIEKALIRN